MKYRLRVPGGSREVVERALSRHAARCPTALSLRGAVAVTWEAEVDEVDEGGERWHAEGSRDA